MFDAYRALVVDDDPVARDAAVLALQDVGFNCQGVGDAGAAERVLSHSKFDVLITDLRMPKRNGHSLAANVINQGVQRPLVFVLTGVLEPKIVKDLIARGVDDISFKPIPMGPYAAKVLALCKRRLSPNKSHGNPPGPVLDTEQPVQPAAEPEEVWLTTEQFALAVNAFAASLPRATVAESLATALSKRDPAHLRLAELVAEDPDLARETVRLAANIAGRSNGAITNLAEAIKRLGEPKVGEIALATATMMAIVSLPDCDWSSHLLVRQGLANAAALEQLRINTSVRPNSPGQLLASLLSPWSRTVFSICCPNVHQRLIARCNSSGASLAGLEYRFLSTKPDLAISLLLRRWNAPGRFHETVDLNGSSYADLQTATDPVRSTGELLLLAQQIGQLAVGHFAPWDEVDAPPLALLDKVYYCDLTGIVQRVRALLSTAVPISLGHSPADETAVSAADVPQERLNYFRMASGGHDWIATFAESLGYKLNLVSQDSAQRTFPVLVNCLNASPERIDALLKGALRNPHRVLIGRGGTAEQPSVHATTISLPNSFRNVTCALQAATETAVGT